MSKAGIQRFLDLMTVSGEFAELYNANPEEALKGFQLTKEEHEALLSKDERLLHEFDLEMRTIDRVTHRRY